MSQEQGQIVKDVEIMHQGLIFKFQIKLMSSDVPPAPPAEQTIDELKIVKVTTSSADDDGNKGDNMLIDDSTKWSCSKGQNCTATFDLGGIQVGEYYVRFAKDVERTVAFEISTVGRM